MQTRQASEGTELIATVEATAPIAPGTSVTPTTTVVAEPPQSSVLDPVERRRSVRHVAREDWFALVGSLAASAALTSILFFWLAPFGGGVGFVVCWYALFLIVYAVAVAQDHSGPAVRDRLAAAVVHGLALVLFAALCWVVLYTFGRGATALRHVNFYFHDLKGVTPTAPLTHGGIAHAIAGSMIELGIALAITIPLGLVTAILLNEIPGRLARTVRTIAEAATALPSIVAGLFIYGLLQVPFTVGGHPVLPKAGFAAALAIGIMMLPIIIRASDVVLRLVPGSLKEASYALGSGQWQTVWRVTLPTARTGLATAVILGTARGIGETSPVLLCAGYGTVMNTDPTKDPMTSLPLAVFTLIRSPEKQQIDRGFGAAAVLMVLVFVLFAATRLLARRRRSLRP